MVKLSQIKKSFLILILVVLVFLLSGCSKTSTLKNDPQNKGGEAQGTSSDTTIASPNNPDFAKTIGFFGDSWKPKSLTLPSSVNVLAVTGQPAAKVTVNMSQVLTKISRNIYGNNTNLWMGQMVSDPVLQNYIKDLSPNILRGPGGSLSDVYFWNAQPDKPPADIPDSIYENGILDNYGYWFGKNDQQWTLSLDNFYSLLNTVNATGIQVVNYGYARYGLSADPVKSATHLAADWVRYDNGRTRYWEIGNECYGNWEAGYRIDLTKNKDGQPLFITGSLYGKHFKVFADSMRAAANELGVQIYIGAVVLDAAPPSWADNTNQNWNKEVFSTAGEKADFFVVHDYFTPYNTNSSAKDILSSATAIPVAAMDYLKSQMAAYHIGEKPVAMTEWNIQAVNSRQAVSNIAGLHAVISLAELIKNKFGEASRWDLANGWNNGDDMGMFNNTRGDAGPGEANWNPRPSFYYLYYFQKYFGDKMLSTVVSGDADVLAYGSSFSSGDASVMIVNKGNKARIVSLRLDNFLPAGKYYWFTLNGGSDNGEFSAQVFVNGKSPTAAIGGPLDYNVVKANCADMADGMTFNLPAYSATFVMAATKQ